MEDNYTKAYQEVVAILKYVPQESVNKIPQEMREMFEEKQSTTHNFKVDTTKPFEEQEILDETKAILANIFRDYWATNIQREKILAKENQDMEEWEQKKREKYNPNDIFKNRIQSKPIVKIEETNNLPMNVKETFFKKIIDFFKIIFHIR